MQYYVIKYVSGCYVGGFNRLHPPIKLTATIAEILLKVALNTIDPNFNPIHASTNNNN
jgi:hypothetical protein